MLAAHEPYPGMVLDGHFTVMLANRACTRLFGTDLVGINFVRDALANRATAGMIVNWVEVGHRRVSSVARRWKKRSASVSNGYISSTRSSSRMISAAATSLWSCSSSGLRSRWRRSRSNPAQATTSAA
jgi:hypothetical protein